MKAVTHLFAEQVAISKNKIAIVDNNVRITFLELEKKSSNVAQSLFARDNEVMANSPQ